MTKREQAIAIVGFSLGICAGTIMGVTPRIGPGWSYYAGGLLLLVSMWSLMHANEQERKKK